MVDASTNEGARAATCAATVPSSETATAADPAGMPGEAAGSKKPALPTDFERLCAFANLLYAYRLAARGKRNRPDVAAFDYDLEGQLLRLRDQLAAGTYRPGPYRRFTVREPKERVISAAPFRDRVVHHALCEVITWRFERRFIRDS